MLGLLLGTVEALMRDVSSMDRVILGLHPAWQALQLRLRNLEGYLRLRTLDELQLDETILAFQQLARDRARVRLEILGQAEAEEDGHADIDRASGSPVSPGGLRMGEPNDRDVRPAAAGQPSPYSGA